MAVPARCRVRDLVHGGASSAVQRPQTSVIWVGRDADVLIFTTHDLRLKARNLRRDPRASVTLFALDNPYNTVDISGTVDLVPDPERKLSVELTRKYTGQDSPPDPPGSARLIGRLAPTRITGMVAA